MDTRLLIEVASGKRPAGLVLKNVRVLNVFTGDIQSADIAVEDGIIAGVGSYSGIRETDLEGRFAVPGFINSHCHVESSMVTPHEYCCEELRHGVTTVITDPHEIANVAGLEGVKFMISSASGLPINYFVQAPSCVPSTVFEHSGAVLDAEELKSLLSDDRVLGLGEMMDFPGVLSCSQSVINKLEAFRGRTIDGHAPSLGGLSLQGYAAAGIHTDHESISWSEAREKLNAGIAVLVRLGSASRNLEDIIRGVVENGVCTRNMAFCTDDKHLADIRREGTIRENIRLAISLGLDTVSAFQMATVNAAEIYGLSGLGAIAPNRRADIVILDELESVAVHSVYKDGVLRVSGGVVDWPVSTAPSGDICRTVHISPLSEKTLALPEREVYPVIEIVSGQIVTRRSEIDSKDLNRSIADGRIRKIAVIERHRKTQNRGVGLISGYGLSHGAIATTIAHDSHNLIVVGDNDGNMLTAVNALKECQGGYSIACDGQVLGVLPLIVGGLMSTECADVFIPKLEEMLKIAKELGVAEGIDPFITLSFLALPVLPELRITDMGMFDSVNMQLL
ncbi:MAG: adenine deaminase [Oscillospiraceae bacterium]